jgi:multidrug efflux pump subunit AcrB
MWIVNLALRRPYTFIVLAVFILIAGVLSIVSTPKDIFPSINIPVISVIFNFAGLSPRDMEQHLTTVYERVLTTTVDNIEHIESESLFGIAVVKIYLQPSASVPRGIAQVTSVSQAILRQLPTGTTPPLVLSYSATNVPVLRVGLSGLSEQQLNDLGLNFVRPQFITVPGVSVPYPYGGKQKFVEIDLNYKALQGYGLTPFDVVNTITAQNLTLPSGTQKIGRFEYLVGLNSSPDTIEKLNAIPIKSLANGTTIYIRDVANIVNGSIPQTNIVRFNGQRATMLDIQKTGSASTRMPTAKASPPKVMIFSVSPIALSAAIEERMASGIEIAMMRVLFQSPKKRRIIIAVRHAAITASRTTPSIAPVTKID